ncbi:MAG: hypothetical protein N2315_08240, partial [Thermanaerothrix sp.]|nr:hypothetical protein [Thermanaerothrix sp.]
VYKRQVLDLAENRLDWILRRARPAEGGDVSPRLESRLLSRHPGVVILALEELRKVEDPGLRERLAVSVLSRGVPDGEVLARILSMFRPSCLDVVRNVCRWGGVYGRAEAVGVLRWIKYGGVRDRGILKPFCANRDLGVLAALLDMWPSGMGLPDVSDMSRFLKSDNEALLGAALRLVKREGPQAWMMPRIEKLASSHPSPAVRVWASAIVRNRSME